MSSSSGIGSGGRVYTPPPGTSGDVGDVTPSSGPSRPERVSGSTPDAPGVSGDSYTTSSAAGLQGPVDSEGSDLDEEIYDNVFAGNGIPDPYGSSTESRGAELMNDPDFRAAVEAGQAYLNDASAANQAAFLDRIGKLPKDGNVMETLLLVIRGSIEEANEDKKYHLRKLQEMNEVSAFLGDQMRIFADASTDLADKERGQDKPSDQTVLLEYALPDTRTTGADGRPIVGDTVSRHVNRDALGVEMKKLETAQEEVKNNKQEFQTAFQAVDSKVNQLYQIMASVSKTMNEERGAPIKNML